MTHRGPFQPQTFCNSVNQHRRAGRVGRKPLESTAGTGCAPSCPGARGWETQSDRVPSATETTEAAVVPLPLPRPLADSHFLRCSRLLCISGVNVIFFLSFYFFGFGRWKILGCSSPGCQRAGHDCAEITSSVADWEGSVS